LERRGRGGKGKGGRRERGGEGPTLVFKFNPPIGGKEGKKGQEKGREEKEGEKVVILVFSSRGKKKKKKGKRGGPSTEPLTPLKKKMICHNPSRRNIEKKGGWEVTPS